MRNAKSRNPYRFAVYGARVTWPAVQTFGSVAPCRPSAGRILASVGSEKRPAGRPMVVQTFRVRATIRRAGHGLVGGLFAFAEERDAVGVFASNATGPFLDAALGAFVIFGRNGFYDVRLAACPSLSWKLVRRCSGFHAASATLSATLQAYWWALRRLTAASSRRSRPTAMRSPQPDIAELVGADADLQAAIEDAAFACSLGVRGAAVGRGAGRGWQRKRREGSEDAEPLHSRWPSEPSDQSYSRLANLRPASVHTHSLTSSGITRSQQS